MIRFLARAAITLLANTIGLLVAALVLPDFHINVVGFVFSALFFSGVELLFEPFVLSLALKYAPALRGGIALVTTFVGLLLTITFTSGLEITSVAAWVLAPMIIWLSVVVAGIVLPMVLFKKALGTAAERRES